jgi:hypothetical protein
MPASANSSADANGKTVGWAAVHLVEFIGALISSRDVGRRSALSTVDRLSMDLSMNWCRHVAQVPTMTTTASVIPAGRQRSPSVSAVS